MSAAAGAAALPPARARHLDVRDLARGESADGEEDQVRVQGGAQAPVDGAAPHGQALDEIRPGEDPEAEPLVLTVTA